MGAVKLRERGSNFSVQLGLIAGIGLLFRIPYAIAERHNTALGDGAYYHFAANYLVAGKGWIDPYAYVLTGQLKASANHPPAWILVLALASLVGAKSVLSQGIAACLVGTATIATVGFAGRRVAGNRVGLIAAGIAAAYPNFWVYERELLSETLLLFGVALTVLLAYRFIDSPSWRRAGLVGAACGLLALTRPEQLMALGLLVVPLVVLPRGVDWRRRVGWLAAASAAALLVIAPWTVYNLRRFDKPEYLSSSFGLALAFSNCPQTYSGPNLGYLDTACPSEYSTLAQRQGEASRIDYLLRTRALHYASRHRDRLPVVVLAREGRTWNLFRPFQQMRFDATWGSPIWVNDVGLFAYWLLAPAAMIGALALRRRRRPVLPMLSFIVTVAIGSAITLGQTRYRAGAEVVVVLLAAVGIDAVIARSRRNGTQPAESTG
jgi:4-amino-4-deoxy-L-arabinose transferase-like glycosyltransferase